MNKYSKGDYVEYMTRQPEVHLQEMFGNERVSLDEIEETKHVGRIKSVIGNGEAYLIISLQPLCGFYCVEDCDKIIRRMGDDELNEEICSYQDSPEHNAPNVYANKETTDGSVKDRCEHIARKAMASLFPTDNVVEVDFGRSLFLKEDILCNLADMMAFYGEGNSKLQDELQKMKNEIDEHIRKKRFKEYYQVNVSVKAIKDEDPVLTAWLEERGFHTVSGEFGTKNYLVAIATDFEEASIMRDIKERSRFFRSLGPEFDEVTNMEARFREAVFEREENI